MSWSSTRVSLEYNVRKALDFVFLFFFVLCVLLLFVASFAPMSAHFCLAGVAGTYTPREQPDRTSKYGDDLTGNDCEQTAK